MTSAARGQVPGRAAEPAPGPAPGPVPGPVPERTTGDAPPTFRDRLARLLDPTAPADPALHGLRVRRAWPANLGDPNDGLVLELQAPEDAANDAGGSATGVGATPPGRVGATSPGRVGATPPGRVGATLTDRGLHLLAGDPKLPSLTARLAAGETVVSLRPGKRAVLRTGDGRYVKLARRTATRRALDRLAAVDGLLEGVAGAPARPAILAGNVTTGMLELAPADGVTLADVLAAASTPADVVTHARACADALVALASVRPGPDDAAGIGTHSLADEATVLARWAVAALELAPLTDVERTWLTGEAARVAQELRDAAGASGTGDAAPVLAHRDLHDGQILCADMETDAETDHGPGGGVRLTVLDWDTAAWAHPAADLANLLAHVDRLARLGRVRPPVAQGFNDHLLDALEAAGHPALTDPAAARLLDVLIEATALRLVAVHAFRPR